MNAFFHYMVFFLIFLSSCKLKEEIVIGQYQQRSSPHSRLSINRNGTFELTGLRILKKPGNPLPGSPLRYRTAGTWQLNRNRIYLSSFATDTVQSEKTMTDSISRFTAITSFNFWNRRGDPVPIRSIQFPSSVEKPHYGNSLYLFSQDFKSTDTVKFHLDGYPVFSYPGTIPYAIGNNMHKIILVEPFLASALDKSCFRIRRNRIIAPYDEIVFTRKK